MMGMLWGGAARMEETVDLPVAIPPVRPTTGGASLAVSAHLELAWAMLLTEHAD